MRRRLYLMRHAEVSYFREDGQPVNPAEVSLNEEGIAQARAAADALAEVELDRVITSGLPRTLETAQIVAQSHKVESWPELTEIRGGRTRTRLLLPQEFRLLVEHSGAFDVVGAFSDFDLTKPLDGSPLSWRMVSVLRRRAAQEPRPAGP